MGPRPNILVTGSAGHLGEALMRHFAATGQAAIGLDLRASAFTTARCQLADRAALRGWMDGVETVFHTATLHKPHVATHSRQDFVDTNITGTLNVLEEAHAAGVRAVVFTSTTSMFGDALVPPPGTPAAWITEEVVPVPKNIYGATKAAAEDLCQLFHRNQGLACVVLRTSRFFPEADDDTTVAAGYDDDNAKVNEFLCRRVDIEDAVNAHLLAAARAPALGFGRYIVSATTPFVAEDLAGLRVDAPAVLRRRVPGWEAVYGRLGWTMFPALDRVYVNARARAELGWRPRHDFAAIVERLRDGGDPRSPLARAVGAKGYHGESSLFAKG